MFLAAQAQGGGMSFIIMMVAIFAIMWFFMIRPQQNIVVVATIDSSDGHVISGPKHNAANVSHA